MKNNSSFFIKTIIVLNTLLFFPMGLKADKPQENIESKSTFKKTLEEIEFDMSEKLRNYKCSLECTVNSNYPEMCKLTCKAQNLKRIAVFKFKKLYNTIRP